MILKQGSIFSEAKKARLKPAWWLQVLIFFLVFFISQIAANIPSIIVIASNLFKEISATGNLLYSSSDLYSLISTIAFLALLYGCLLGAVVVFLYCLLIEKRSLHSMGFVRKGAFISYLTGWGAGAILFSIAILIGILTGSVQFIGFHSQISIGFILIFFIGYLIQGMYEEVLMRGYFMISLANKSPLILAILLNSILFGLIHGLNPGVTPFSILNIILFGVFASIVIIKSNNIWFAGAMHAAWNFVQGNIFGVKVSGMNPGPALFNLTYNPSGSLINGGSFGMEGGLAVTIVYILGIVLCLMYKEKSDQ